MIPAAGAARAGAPATAPRTMPPLHGPPVDGDGDDWDDDGENDPRRRRRTRLIWAAAALAVLLLVAGGVTVLLSGRDGGSAGNPSASGPTSTRPSAPASTNATGGVEFDVASYIGEDADQVEQELEALGLEVDQADATDAQLQEVTQDLDEHTVVTADPARGPLAQGALVTLYVTGAPYTPEDSDNGGDGDETAPAAPTTGAQPPAPSGGGNSPTQSSAVTTRTKPTTTATTPPTTTTATTSEATTPPTVPTSTADESPGAAGAGGSANAAPHLAGTQ